MNNIYFYLILSTCLYFIFTRVLENFLVEQENFDPSLVPVSSIVTLAKVAQKLVNGNGTLTNPGNLQIGASTSAPGNLTVTGTLGVSGKTTLKDAEVGSLNVKKGTASPDWTKLSHGDGSGWRVRFQKDDANPIMDIYDNSNAGVQVNGNLSVAAGSGNNGININSATPFISFNKTGKTSYPQIYSDGTILHAYNAPFQVDQNLTVQGDTTVGNNLTVTGTTTLNYLKIKGASTTPTTVTDKFTHFNNSDGNNYIRGNTLTSGSLNVGGTTTINDSLTVSGNINARTNGYNTRIGSLWTSPGIYAEGSANLEIGAGSNNIYIGAANGGANQNLTVTGNLTANGMVLNDNGLKVTNQIGCKTLCVGNGCINETQFGMLLNLVNGTGICMYDTSGGTNFTSPRSLSRNITNDRFDYAGNTNTPKVV